MSVYRVTILDGTIVNVAQPAIRQQFSASVSDLQWVVDGYALMFSALLLSAGALGDRVGSKRLFLAGLMIITIGSALCDVAPALRARQAARDPGSGPCRASGPGWPRGVNTSRPVGGVIGVALLVALADGHRIALAGLARAFLVAGSAFLLGCALTLL